MAGPKPSRVVLFDLDGTLIDSAADIVRLMNLILAQHARPEVALGEGRLMIGRGARTLLERGFAATGGPCADLDGAEAAFLRLYQDDTVQHTTLYPGALATLDTLAKQGWVLGLATNKPIGPTRAALRHFGLQDRFQVVYGGDSVGQKKPAPEMLLRAIADLGGSPDRAVMIGDSDNDILAARAGGVRSIAVSYGYSREPVESFGPDCVTDQLDTIPALVSSLVPA